MYFLVNILENYLRVWSLENVTISRLSSGVFLQPNSRITSLCPKKLWTGKSRCLWFQRNSEWSFLCNWGTITVANLDKKCFFIISFIKKNNYVLYFVTYPSPNGVYMAFQTGTAVLSVVKGLDACCESTRIKFKRNT